MGVISGINRGKIPRTACLYSRYKQIEAMPCALVSIIKILLGDNLSSTYATDLRFKIFRDLYRSSSAVNAGRITRSVGG